MSYSMPPTVQFGPHEISTKTEMGKELWGYERKPDYDPRKNQYPKMLYKAYKMDDGAVKCMDTHPKPFLYPNMEMYRLACEQVDQFNISCQLTIGKGLSIEADRNEHETAHSQGWRDSPQEAKDFVFGLQKEMAKAYAERAYQEQNMSPKARAEAQAVDDSTPEHVPVIPEARTVRRGRPKGSKNAVQAA